jgi:TetR/AcrR family transcriptional regulator, ethionamide resistance regulator
LTRRRSGEPRKGDLREVAILDAAEALLSDTGYDSMTISDVAEGAGISRGALYFYFGSKQEIITALFARTVAILHQKSYAAAEDAADGPQAIDTALRRTEDLWREHGVVMRTAIDLAATIPELDVLWKETADIFIGAITAILEHLGVPAGRKPDQSAAIAEALCWMIERNFYQASRVSAAQLSRARQTCTEIWLRSARAN